CYCIEQLNINGKYLINLGYKQGPIIKSILEKILKEVINGNLQNTHEQLLSYANKLKTNII
ncbi:MAG: polynucleotide adenylyltransferase, partial [Oscillospiraceae bacterium]|nr:polynucleotide adenylyltransferase [Oscillospiraceae bacterium]